MTRVPEFGPGMVIMSMKGLDLWPCRRLTMTSEVIAELVDVIEGENKINLPKEPDFFREIET